jgi:hypothetical protein
VVQGGSPFHAWRRIAATHYGHTMASLEVARRCYSMHYLYITDDGCRYVLSKVRKDERRIPFSTQFELVQRLSASLDTVKEVVLTDGHRSWVDTRRHHWFVRRRSESAVLAGEPGSDLIVQAAQVLGRVHTAVGDPWAEGGVPSAFGADHLDPYYWSSVDVIDRLDVLLSGRRLGRLPKADADLVRQVAKSLSGLRPWDALGPFGLTHQDYRPENILVSEGRIVEVIDWDRARPDHQVFDAVLASVQFGSSADGGFDWLRSQRFVQAYLQDRSLSVPPEILAFAFRLAAVKGACVSRTPTKWMTVLRAVEQVSPVRASSRLQPVPQ